MAGIATGGRKVYQRQPARAVLLEMSPLMDSYSCLNICDALSSTLNIIVQLHGVPCLTHLCLILLGTYPKCLFPLQPIKGNLQRVSTALKSVGQEVQGFSRSCSGCLVEGIGEALEQFQRVIQNTKQSIATPSQIEITVLTGRSGQSVRDTLVRSSDRLNLEHLRKITVVCVSDPDRIARQNTPLVSGCDDVEGPQEAEQHVGLSQMTCSQAELGMSMLDIVSADNDVLSLSNVFKQWLTDCSTDSEHLHLCLPACLGDTPVTLKCDLQGTIIDPQCLSTLGETFTLNTRCRPTTASKVTSPALSPPLPLYKLRAEALLEPEGVCESVLFGLPLVLRPTACWRLDWEELESNQQTFAALCRMLQNKGKCLLTVADTADINPRFLILPSPSPSLGLMIKSIAVQELMMPSEVLPSEEQPPQEVMRAVEQCLDTLELKSTYNPLRVLSNLHHALSISSNKRGSLSKGPRTFTGGFQQSRGTSNEKSSLGPRKNYKSARYN